MLVLEACTTLLPTSPAALAGLLRPHVCRYVFAYVCALAHPSTCVHLELTSLSSGLFTEAGSVNQARSSLKRGQFDLWTPVLPLQREELQAGCYEHHTFPSVLEI